MSLKATTYFIQSTASCNIKIGHTNDLRQRFQALQMMSGDTIVVLGVLNGDWEDMLHVKFAAYRLHGEWFSPSVELRTYVAMYAKPWHQPKVEHVKSRIVFRLSDHLPSLRELQSSVGIIEDIEFASFLECLPKILQRIVLHAGISTMCQLKAMTDADFMAMYSMRGVGSGYVDKLRDARRDHITRFPEVDHPVSLAR